MQVQAGVVTFTKAKLVLVSLRELKKRIQEKASDYEKYQIRYENAEDFDIVNDDKVISRHQVKAYKDGEERKIFHPLLYTNSEY